MARKGRSIPTRPARALGSLHAGGAFGERGCRRDLHESDMAAARASRIGLTFTRRHASLASLEAHTLGSLPPHRRHSPATVSHMSEQRAFARGLVDLVRVVLSRYVLIGGSQFAAAISYRALFSLVPLATFAATILAQVLSSSSANRQDVVSAIDDQLKLSPRGGCETRCADHIRSFALEPRRCGGAWASALGRHGRDVVDAKDTGRRVRESGS